MNCPECGGVGFIEYDLDVTEDGYLLVGTKPCRYCEGVISVEKDT